MLTVPDSIKDLLHLDSCKKNIRIHFPNGERQDICNDLIVKDSVSFTESLCSQNSLKFGLCESPVFECEVVGVSNITGASIEVSCEVFCDSSVSGAEWRLDLEAYVYSIPYGTFVVSECKRQADMIHRKITAYAMLRLEEISQNPSLLAYINCNWYDNTPIVLEREVIELLLFKNTGSESYAPLVDVSGYVGLDWNIDGHFISFHGNAIYRNYGINSWGYTAHETHYNFRKTDLYFDESFDFDNYLYQCEVFRDAVKYRLDLISAIDEATKKEILRWTTPLCREKYDVTFVYDHAKSSDGESYWTDYTTEVKDSDPSNIPIYKNIKKRMSLFAWMLFKNITDTSTVEADVYASGEAFLFAPSDGFYFNIDGHRIYFSNISLYQKVTEISKSERYTVGDTLEKDDIVIPRVKSKTRNRQKTTYNQSGDVTGKSNTTRTEYLPNGNASKINIADYYAGVVEISGLFVRLNRYGDAEKVDIAQNFILTPYETLYPNTNLYPQGAVGGKIFPQDYQSCWYEDDYTLPYGAIDVVYKSSSTEEEFLRYYFNGFDEDSIEGTYRIYDISDNYCIKNNTFTEVQITAFIQNIVTKLAKVRYMPVEFIGRGLPYVEPGDTFEILTKSNDSITTIVLNRTLSGEQVLTDSYKSV